MKNTRRSFIKMAALASAAPFILPSHLVSAQDKPSGRLNIGFIGMGKQNRGLLYNFILSKNVQVVAVCDVDTNRRNAAQKYANDYYTNYPQKGTADCKAYKDMRELIARDDIDLVCIATPDHWHAYPTVAALKAGKDVYCEKPLTHNIHEAITVMDTVKQTGRVLQTGSMQRSMGGFRTACELVQNGVIGKISHVDCSFGGPGVPCDLPEEPMEPGLDWDRWVGPAKMRPYNSILSPRGVHDHFPNWRKYKEFGSGMVGDWGAHHLDIAQWGLGMDDSGPVEVHPPKEKGKTEGAKLIYANGIVVNHLNSGYGVQFYGENGQVKVNRGRFELILDGKTVVAHDPNDRTSSLYKKTLIAEKNYLKDAKVKLYNSTDHTADFLNCVASRKKPITSEIVGGHSAICCHLVNQAYYNHAKISWDPKKLAFANGTGKPEWLTRDYRSPWAVR
ncbi:MAG: Gfo/Idh/MocA family oxidoreductase [Anaerohalosphaera sp.]|nr:Gfo/Idh/MocA family oxidoreductase [Anaerohalosphaera sp.]